VPKDRPEGNLWWHLGLPSGRLGSPHRVDIRVPPTGLGGRLSAMLTWCRENVPAGAWDMHWHSEKKAGGDTARLRAVLLRERSGR
jgi:hypothetical protein